MKKFIIVLAVGVAIYLFVTGKFKLALDKIKLLKKSPVDNTETEN